MANAKKCDICGKYYDVPSDAFMIDLGASSNTSMVRIPTKQAEGKGETNA